MRTLFAIVAKDLRLLWRDRAGLVFIAVAPIVVICVAGFSLANLYGVDPSGQTAYEFPFVDEDHSELSRRIRERLEREPAIRVHPAADRDEAARLVGERKLAGTALIVPQGTAAAVQEGRDAKLILYTDTVKYLERLNVQTRLLEMRDVLARERQSASLQDAAAARERLQADLRTLGDRLAALRDQLEQARATATHAREKATAQWRAAAERAHAQVETQLRHELADAMDHVTREVQGESDAVRAAVNGYLETVAARRREFEAWLNELKRMAGSHAADIPPPPSFPEIPAPLRQRLERGPPPLAPPALHVAVPDVALPALPDPPALPVLALPEIVLPPAPSGSAALSIEEVNVSGGPSHINTFDQNVPGFSVTFLLLGMLLGVSLGLLDERDWGTLDRQRAMPIASRSILLGKLLSRFLVGFAQMIALFAVGRLAFAISLGPQPWALLLPTAGIVFAGTAFGLIVAGVAASREAVLPVGSIVIVTMAAVGGCWWPIDLEPRWMRAVALGFPTTWAMDAFNDLMIRRRPIAAALVPTAVMVGYGVLYLTVGLALFRRRARA